MYFWPACLKFQALQYDSSSNTFLINTLLCEVSIILIDKSFIVSSTKAGRNFTVYMQMRVEKTNKAFAYNHKQCSAKVPLKHLTGIK